MKRTLGILSVFALIASLGIQIEASAQELAPRDRNRVPAVLLTDPGTGLTDRWESDGAGAAKVNIAGSSGPVTVVQGLSGLDTDGWNSILRNPAGTEYGLAASPFGVSLFDAASNLLGVTANPFVVDLGVNNDVVIQDTAGAPGSVRLSDGTSFYDGATDRVLSTAPFSMRLSDGASFYDGAQDRILATAPFAVRQTDGTSFFKAAEDRITAGAPSSSQLSNGSAFYAAMDQATGDDIELNTDSPTVFGSGTVSVTTAATLISAASPSLRSRLIRNADSNTVLYVGPTSGVTTANGVPVKIAGATGANGNGGTIIYTHTAAIWGIVASGTADVRFQSESD